jgi:hypothetical protein
MLLDQDKRDGFFKFDRMTDIIFIVDLVFNFFTGQITKEGAVVLDRRTVMKVGPPLRQDNGHFCFPPWRPAHRNKR